MEDKITFSRRTLLQAGLGAATLFMPAPYAWVWAQSEGSLRLLRAPKVALTIGNSGYRESPLKNPSNDAREIGIALGRAGFEVTTKLDAPRSELAAAVQAYTQALAARQAVGVFYFAGHGLQLAWRNYMVPVDAALNEVADIQAQCVELGVLVAGIAKARNPLNIIILDACRDNPFGSLVGADQKGLSQMDAPLDTLLAYATAPGNVASDGEGANGLYTEHLLKEIAVPEAKVEDVFKRVRLHVRRQTQGRQIPWESTSLVEDFFFIPPRKLALQLASEQERQRMEQQKALEQQRTQQSAEAPDQQELAERQYREESTIWEQIKESGEAEPLVAYLLRFPSGRFSELAQFQLDRVLARRGEKRIEIVSDAKNPFSNGSMRIDTGYKVGDQYRYREIDMLTGLELRNYGERVTAIAASEVIFNDGRLVTDFLGNVLLDHQGIRFSVSQFYIPEYSVGKRWSARYIRQQPDGRAFDFEYDFKVITKERTTVPAGTFDAFRIEGTGWTRSNNGYRVNLQTRYWVTPGVRRAIAWENLDQHARGRYMRSEREEMVSYTQT